MSAGQLADLDGSSWDVVVVGAGPAGATSAALLARQHRSVLLLDHAEFPREKPCGCCLGARGVRLLRNLGLNPPANAQALHALEIRHHRRSIAIRIPQGLALSRSDLDAALVHHATSAGARFVDQTSAVLLPTGDHSRALRLTRRGQVLTVRSSLVVAADGLRGQLLHSEPGCHWQIAAHAWMGLSLTLAAEPGVDVPPGFICMHLGGPGYAGVVRLPDGHLHLAAAVDPSAARRVGPGELLERLVAAASGWTPSLTNVRITGTPLLTRNREVFGSQRVLAVGDACGYIEPFTGEGMTWAIQSAIDLVAFLPATLADLPHDLAIAWTHHQRRRMLRERTLCRTMRFLLHHATLREPTLQMAHLLPTAAQWIAARLDPLQERPT